MNQNLKKLGMGVFLLLVIVGAGLLIMPVYKALADSFSAQVAVSNAAPAISSPKMNLDADITLNENASTTKWITFTATDANGCSTITVATSSFYRSDVSCALTNYTGCYYNMACSVTSTNTCTGGTDTSADYVCTTTLAYYADATAAGSTQAANTWSTAVHISDGTDIDDDSTATQVEINITTALDVTPATMEYNGGVAMSAGTDSGTINSTSTITNTGNEKMKVTVGGSNLLSGGNNIPVANQKYATSSFDYGTGDVALSVTPAQVGLIWQHATSTSGPVTDDVYYGINIPNGQAPGTYSSAVTTTAALGV